MLQLLAASLVAAGAQAAEDQASAGQAASADYYFDLPAGTLNSGVSSLQLSVDDYDVTEFAALEGERLRFSPAIALQPGNHQVVIVAFYADGNIKTLLEQSFAVTGGTRKGNWSALLSNQFRVADNPPDYYQDAPDSLHQLTLNGRTEVVQGNWQYTASGNYIAATEAPVQGVNGHSHVPNYQAAALYNNDAVSFGMRAGDLPAVQDGLLFSQFARRGASVEAGLPQQGLNVQMQVTHSEPVSLISEGLVLPDTSSEETQSAQVQWQPVRSNPGALKLTAGYINGESDLLGLAVTSNNATLYGGDAWSFGLESWLLGNSLWLQGAMAQSRFDLDGLEQGEDKVRDDAAQATVQLSSQGILGTPSWLHSWMLGYHWQQVGLNFYSLGNLALPGDVELNKLYGQLQYGGWSLDWSAAQEHTDVDDDPARARQNNELVSVILQYSMTQATEGWRYWVKPAGFFIQANHSNQAIEDGDEMLAGFDMDLDLQEYTLGLQWQYETLFWSLQHTYSRSEDSGQDLYLDDLLLSQAQPDTNSNTTQWQMSWRPTANIQLGPWVQWMQQDYAGDEYSYRVTGLAANFAFPQQRITLDMDYNLERNHSRFELLSDKQLTRQYLANLDLRWTAVEANSAFSFMLEPAVILYCKGNYGRAEDEVVAVGESHWQILFGVDLQWGNQG